MHAGKGGYNLLLSEPPYLLTAALNPNARRGPVLYRSHAINEHKCTSIECKYIKNLCCPTTLSVTYTKIFEELHALLCHQPSLASPNPPSITLSETGPLTFRFGQKSVYAPKRGQWHNMQSTSMHVTESSLPLSARLDRFRALDRGLAKPYDAKRRVIFHCAFPTTSRDTLLRRESVNDNAKECGVRTLLLRRRVKERACTRTVVLQRSVVERHFLTMGF